jgi:CheY-like chemotaxis protein
VGLAWLAPCAVDAQGTASGVRRPGDISERGTRPGTSASAHPGESVDGRSVREGFDGSGLVIDDDTDNRRFLQQVLQVATHDVHTARDGQDALTWLRTQSFPPDCIVLDLDMPIMTVRNYLADCRRTRNSVKLESSSCPEILIGTLVTYRAVRSALRNLRHPRFSSTPWHGV